MKHCYHCGASKPLEDFNKQAKADDGLQHMCRECQRCQKFQYRYGISLARYNELVAAQGNLCAVCGETPSTGHNGILVVDHDHQTNAVRELLCNNCNVFLGHAKDDISILEAGIEYLKKHS